MAGGLRSIYLIFDGNIYLIDSTWNQKYFGASPLRLTRLSYSPDVSHRATNISSVPDF